MTNLVSYFPLLPRIQRFSKNFILNTIFKFCGPVFLKVEISFGGRGGGVVEFYKFIHLRVIACPKFVYDLLSSNQKRSTEILFTRDEFLKFEGRAYAWRS